MSGTQGSSPDDGRAGRQDRPEEPPPPADGLLRLTVEAEDDGRRLDHFLATRMPWRSRTRVESLIQDGKVTLADRAARPSRKVRAGETIQVQLPAPKRDVELAADGGEWPLKVLYEDRHLLAIDKPPNIPVHPGGRLLYHTVITELAERYRTTGDERDVVPKLCHRLDLETSGVLLVGKEDGVVAEVGRQLRERETLKEYLAIVYGVVEDDEALIDAPLGPAPGARVHMRRAVRPDGAVARTGVRVERRYRDYTLVRLRLYTGRRHQLRVHLAHLGHPIVGDKLYGIDEDYFLAYYEDRLDADMRGRLVLERQALHATRVVIRHPITGEVLEVVSPLAADLSDFLATLPPAP